MTKVIKWAIPFRADPSMHIFNRSFEVGILPNNLKHAKVISVFKTDDNLLISNYRPISLSKALEKIMHSRLMTFFLNQFNIICENQYGFREKHPTVMAQLHIIYSKSAKMDNKKYTIGIFLNLTFQKHLIP